MSALVRILSRPVGDETNSVDARELHQALGVGEHFSTWIKKRIEELSLVAGTDYDSFSESPKNPFGGRPSIEYVVSLDAAKHLAMAERSEAGRRIRAYFIEAEKQFRSVVSHPPAINYRDPLVIVGVIQSLQADVAQLTATVAEQAPKVEIYDRIVDCGDTFGFREACQQIRAATGDTENTVRAFMRERGWIQKLAGGLAPAHVGVERGYVTTRERTWTDVTGASHVRPELRITPKGVAKAIESFLRAESAE